MTDEQIANIHAEALAAKVLASCALRLLLNTRPDVKAMTEALSAYVDRSLSLVPGATGNERLDTLVREMARSKAQDDLAWIKAIADMD